MNLNRFNDLTQGHMKALVTKLGGVKIVEKLLKGILKVVIKDGEVSCSPFEKFSGDNVRIYKIDENDSMRINRDLSLGVGDPFTWIASKAKKNLGPLTNSLAIGIEGVKDTTIWIVRERYGETIKMIMIFAPESVLVNRIPQAHIKQQWAVDLIDSSQEEVKHMCITIQDAQDAKDHQDTEALELLSQIASGDCTNCKRIWQQFLSQQS